MIYNGSGGAKTRGARNPKPMNTTEALNIIWQVKGAFVADGKTHEQIGLAIRIIENALLSPKAPEPGPGLNKPEAPPTSPPVTMPPIVQEAERERTNSEEVVEQRLRRNHVRS
jgi:hypothetical protein